MESQITRLTGKVIQTNEGDLRICLVEFNSLNFTQAKKKHKFTTTLVAWAVSLENFVEGACERDDCTPMDPFSICDADIHEYVDKPLHTIRPREICRKSAAFLTGIDCNLMTRNGKYVFDELTKCNKELTVIDLCRALDSFTINEIKIILCEDIKLKIDFSGITSSRDKMCLYQRVLEQIIES